MIVCEPAREASRRIVSAKSGEARARLKAESLQRNLAEAVDAQALQARADDWRALLQPTGPTQEWLVDEVAGITIKLDHAGKVDRTLRDQAAIRAETCWDLDRRLDAETLARNISKRPGEVVIALRRTVQGCDLLIARWAMLAHLADQNGHWDEAQIGMAFDLLGTPPEFRGADPCFRLDNDGRVLPHPDGAAGFARVQLATLRDLRATVESIDDFDREAIIADLADPPTSDFRRFRRHESALQNRLKWYLNQLKADRTASATTTPPKPKPKPKPKPTPIVVPPPEPEDESNDVPTDDELVAWFRAEAIKAGFDDPDALLPSRANRDQMRADLRRDEQATGAGPRSS